MWLADQRARWWRDGFLVWPDFLSGPQLELLRSETASYHDSLRHGAPADVRVSWETQPGADGRRIQQILNAERLSPHLNDIIRSPVTLDRIEPLIGPDIGLFEAKFILKSPQVGGAVPWHQDFAYWKDTTDAPWQVNLLVYVDDADEENGCLEVIAGSHLHGLVPHGSTEEYGVFGHALRGPGPEEASVVKLPGKAGTALLFGPLLVHRSGANRSGRPRRSFTAVFTPLWYNQWCREALRSRPRDGRQFRLFDAARVPGFTGDGPHGGQCAAAYRRRELWKFALAHVADPRDPWVELGTSLSEGESLAFFAARRERETELMRFDRCPAVAVGVNGVQIVGGFVEEVVQRTEIRQKLGNRIGLLHFESGQYAWTGGALQALRPWIKPGTIMLFDKFHGFPDWERHGALALQEFAESTNLRVASLARSDHQVVVQIRGDGDDSATLPVEWPCTTAGISFGCPPVPQQPPRSREASSAEATAPRLVARLGRAARRVPRAARKVAGAFSPSSASDDRIPLTSIPQVGGDGPRWNYCPTHSRRRELWRLAMSLVDDPTRSWCEFGVGEGESLDWLALHKPGETVLFGFDSFEGLPEPWLKYHPGHWKAAPYQPNRDDVIIVPGPFERTLADERTLGRLGTQIGLLHVDCDLYTSTRTVLSRLAPLIRPGTVIVFDEFYGFPGWEYCEARAFREFVQAYRVPFEFVARADFQMLVRIGEGRSRFSHDLPRLGWHSGSAGVRINPVKGTAGPVAALLMKLRRLALLRSPRQQ